MNLQRRDRAGASPGSSGVHERAREYAVRPEAASLVRQVLTGDDRILVTGASGWFGRTTVALFGAAFGGDAGTRMLLTSRSDDRLELGSTRWRMEAPDAGAMVEFSPTVVVNCAFPTRELVGVFGWERYVVEATKATSQWLQLLATSSLRAAVTFSSGAALRTEGVREWDAVANAYGYMKAVEERATIDIAFARNVGVTVARPWSVSGAHVQRPRDYAFSDFVAQSKNGSIVVESGPEVWRRYCAVDDLIAVSLALASGGTTRVLDSGGELVELGALAARIGAASKEACRVVRLGEPQPSSVYAPSGFQFEEACSSLGYIPATLDNQIHDALNVENR